MLRGVFRTKEGKIIAAALGLLIIATGIFAFVKHSDEKRFVEQAVMAENYLKAGSYEQAVQAYIKALSMKDSDEQLLTIGLAEAYVGMDEYDKALEALRSCYQKISSNKIKEKIEEVTAKKTDYEYLQAVSRAEVYFSNQEYDKAIAEYEKAKLIKSKEATSYRRIAEAYIEKGEYSMARDEVLEGQAITQDESLDETMILVDSYLLKQQYDALVKDASEYIYQENYEDGISEYKEAIKLMPNEIMAYKGLAEAYMAEEQYDKTVLLLQAAVKLVSSDELDEILKQASELKEAADEKQAILSKLYHALKTRDTATITAVMDMKFFKEKIVQDTPLLYDPKGKDGQTNGMMIIYANKSMYYGGFSNGIRKGKGFLFIRSNLKEDQEYYFYDGEWSNDLPNGNGQTCEAYAYENSDGEEYTNKLITEGVYKKAYENGIMTKHFYEDGEETGWVEYKAENGVPMPLTNDDEQPIPTPEAEDYVIGAIYQGDQPTGEYYSAKPQTVWGVEPFIRKE
jgi:tetratricopeptide (TPR) repeat protein